LKSELLRFAPVIAPRCCQDWKKNEANKIVFSLAQCLKDAHSNSARECKLEKSQWRCINCNQKGHSSAYGGCPEVLLRKKAMEIQAQEYMPYASALARAKKEMINKHKHHAPSSQPSRPCGRDRLLSSSPVRQLNYAAAARVGVPDVSAITIDHVSFAFKKKYPQ
jgi:hypothetical protein